MAVCCFIAQNVSLSTLRSLDMTKNHVERDIKCQAIFIISEKYKKKKKKKK